MQEETDKQRLGQRIGMISSIRVGEYQVKSRDVVGCVNEYFLSRFASGEVKGGGES